MIFSLWASAPSSGRDDREATRRIALATSDGTPTRSLSPEDQAVLAQLQSGDEHAFDMLFLAIVPDLCDFARRIAPLVSAEDVVQDVMADLWVRRMNLVVQGSLRGYLYGAVRRRALYAARQQVSGAHLTDRVTMENAAPVAPAADEGMEHAELDAAVAAAVAALPERARLVIGLRWRNGLSYQQIADALGLSVEAAKKQGQRAEAALRALLSHYSAS